MQPNTPQPAPPPRLPDDDDAISAAVVAALAGCEAHAPCPGVAGLGPKPWHAFGGE